MKIIDEKTLYVLIQLLGAFFLFSGKWIPFPFNFGIGLILIVYGALKYREIGKKGKK